MYSGSKMIYDLINNSCFVVLKLSELHDPSRSLGSMDHRGKCITSNSRQFFSYKLTDITRSPHEQQLSTFLRGH